MNRIPRMLMAGSVVCGVLVLTGGAQLVSSRQGNLEQPSKATRRFWLSTGTTARWPCRLSYGWPGLRDARPT